MPGTDPYACVRDGYMIVALRGELDLCAFPGTMRVLSAKAASGMPVIAELAELAFIDCASARGLMSVRDQAQRAGGGLALAGPQPAVLRVLRLTGADSRCPVFATVHDAMYLPSLLLSPCSLPRTGRSQLGRLIPDDGLAQMEAALALDHGNREGHDAGA